MSPDRATLLSLRPRFAEAILAGTKTVEIRRRRVRIPNGSLCLVYASGPTMALVGAVRVKETHVLSPEEMWARWGHETALTRPEFDAYVDGSPLPCAIVVEDATRLTHPVPLSELRRRQDAFVTPQSYRFVESEELASITNGQAQQLERLRLNDAALTTTAVVPTPTHDQ